MAYYNTSYGSENLTFSIPDDRKVDVFTPQVSKSDILTPDTVESKIRRELSNPKLSYVMKSAKSIVIMIDDNTRPTPTETLLSSALDIISQHTEKNAKISILVATGAHRSLSDSEIIGLVGKDIANNYEILNHSAFDNSQLISLGSSSFGTPIWLNRRVRDADLRILTGMIKPHNQAGYTGGGKAILPGVCGFETILSNHSFRYMSHPRSRLGVVDGNPIRLDIEEVCQRVGPSFVINAVMDHYHQIIDVVVGDAIEQHRLGSAAYDRIGRTQTTIKASVCICGTPSPIDINFYQMLNSISAPYRTSIPIIKDGGTIVVFGEAIEGISDGDMKDAFSRYQNEELWQLIQKETWQFSERPAIQILLEGMMKYNIIAVTRKQNIAPLEQMGIRAFSDTEAEKAIQFALDPYDENDSIFVIPYAPYSIIDYKKSGGE